MDPVTRGDVESPLRWTSKSTRKLAAKLATQGYPVSRQKVGQLLYVSGHSLQATQKTLKGRTQPNRNDHFEFINDRVDAFHGRGADLLFEIVSRRYGHCPSLITTNLPLKRWGTMFPNASCAVALIDRLT